MFETTFTQIESSKQKQNRLFLLNEKINVTWMVYFSLIVILQLWLWKGTKKINSRLTQNKSLSLSKAKEVMCCTLHLI